MSTDFNPNTRAVVSAIIGIGALGCLTLPAPEAAEPSLKQAMGVYESGDYVAAAQLLLPHAAAGDALSQLRLATLYRTGNGVEADEYEAAHWYARAADQGLAEAQFHLGLMYLYGLGVTENSNLAMDWISRAAAQGFGDAEDLFGYMLAHEEPLAC